MLTPSNHLSSLDPHRPISGVVDAAHRDEEGGAHSHDLDDEADEDEDDIGHETSSLTGEELLEEQQRRAEAAEDEVLHMTELLSKRRESEARRHLMMAEMEADMERDHRLRAAATAMALAAVSNLSPARKARAHRFHTHTGRCIRHSRHAGPLALPNIGLTGRDTYGTFPSTAYREEDMVISITKSPAGLGFSLTTKPLRSIRVPGQPGSVEPCGEEPVAICVKNILPGGAALKEGQLRLGDRLLQVDDQDVSDKTQAQIVSMLRVKPVGSVVKLLIRRQFPPPDPTSVPRPVSVGLTCPGCLVHKPDYLPYGPVLMNNAQRVHPHNYPHSQPQAPPQSQHQHHHRHQPSQQSRQRAQLQQRQQLMEELTHRTHSHYPVCHTLQATKLSSLTGTRLPNDRTIYRCASPPLLQHTTQFLDDLPDVTSTTDYPPYPDVLIFRLDIPLVCKSSTSTIPTTTGTGLITSGDATVETGPSTDGTKTATTTTSRHMRLGVSVRETCSSRASKLAERLLVNSVPGPDTTSRLPLHLVDENWARDLGADSVYGGVLVKGIIEGGAAHKVLLQLRYCVDGRLRVGDELLEVNGVPLVNASSPLGLLRSVLRQLTSSPTQTTDSIKPDSVDNALKLGDLNSQMAKHIKTSAGADVNNKPPGNPNVEPPSQTVPTVELLTARQMRHRRSASGHTLASNSEFWTETSPGSTMTTTTTTCQMSAVSIGQRGPSTSTSSGLNNKTNLRPLSDLADELETPDPVTVGPSHAVQIAADVHSHRLGDEIVSPDSDTKSGGGAGLGRDTTLAPRKLISSDVSVTTTSVSVSSVSGTATSSHVNKPI
ncbi:unnamed protein product [Echinostoma caproni]|uniref:PDZ domain-containing protein n=1 Tax=Echinostoma caproni TaxID=27848 RepID=A0A183AEV0_9TREM|nr:unnamed protein product [Echinostoma caproni]